MSAKGEIVPSRAELTRRVNEAHERCERAQQDALLAGWDAGDALLQIKADVGHGNFDRWIADRFDGSRRTAGVYCQLRRAFPNRQHAAKLGPTSIRQALQLTSSARKPATDNRRDDESQPEQDLTVPAALTLLADLTDEQIGALEQSPNFDRHALDDEIRRALSSLRYLRAHLKARGPTAPPCNCGDEALPNDGFCDLCGLPLPALAVAS
jgi:hypothetical protein